MVLKTITFAEQSSDALGYLVKNTDVTFLGQGSIARALIEATLLETTRLYDFINTNYANVFLSSAQAVYLDLFGEQVGLPRIGQRRAAVKADERIIKFYVDSGTLGSKLPNPADPSKGTIPKGTVITNAAGTVTYVTDLAAHFPINSKKAFVSATATSPGSTGNVGINQLTVHSLADSTIKVTNDVSITSGQDNEPDNEYRFRLSKAMTTRFGGNETAIKVAASVQPGVSSVEVVPFARGSGTYDVLLIPVGNRVSNSVKENTRRALEAVTAYGISPRVREPDYVPVKVTARLRFASDSTTGEQAAVRQLAQSAILDYLSSISIGGELIINQLRAAMLSASSSIKDVELLELCIDGRPRAIRNFQLDRSELIIPDDESNDPILVI